jgi:hypothetical protein
MLIIVLFCFPQVWESIAEPLTRRLESGLVDLAIALDDVNLAYGAVGKQGDLPGALVPAYCHGTTLECFDKDYGLVGGHGKAISECLVIE